MAIHEKEEHIPSAPTMELYASLGIPDYFLCDIEELYLPSPLIQEKLARLQARRN